MEFLLCILVLQFVMNKLYLRPSPHASTDVGVTARAWENDGVGKSGWPRNSQMFDTSNVIQAGGEIGSIFL